MTDDECGVREASEEAGEGAREAFPAGGAAGEALGRNGPIGQDPRVLRYWRSPGGGRPHLAVLGEHENSWASLWVFTTTDRPTSRSPAAR